MRVKRFGVLAAVGAIIVGLTACMPSFPSGSTLTVAPLGPLVKISWPTLTTDTDKTVASYRVDVDGVQIASLAPSQSSCVVIGLPINSTKTISVTGYDSANQWSGSATTGVVSAPYTTPTTGPGAGATLGCVSPTDTDSDRLPNAVETNTGSYLSAASTGSNPNVADTDVDGIKDGDEALGTAAGVYLPGMGASPTKKDLAFEFDWFDDNAEPASCTAHSHRPTAGAINKVVTAYANAPVSNPNGTTGIHVIADYGQGGAFTGGNLVADADGVIADGVNGTDYTAIKTANFNTNRQGIFHYVELVHRYGTTSTSSGQAEIGGNDLIVSLYCFATSTYYSGSDQYVANTIVHENGHNLGLRHGGGTNTPNYKPNYNSVMNYQYQFPGVDSNCLLGGDNVLNYSTGSRRTLNESALVEADGMCVSPVVPIDWNGNAVIDPGTIARNINSSGDSTLDVLTDFNDWANISLTSVTLAGASPTGSTDLEVITEQPVPALHG